MTTNQRKQLVDLLNKLLTEWERKGVFPPPPNVTYRVEWIAFEVFLQTGPWRSEYPTMVAYASEGHRLYGLLPWEAKTLILEMAEAVAAGRRRRRGRLRRVGKDDVTDEPLAWSRRWSDELNDLIATGGLGVSVRRMADDSAEVTLGDATNRRDAQVAARLLEISLDPARPLRRCQALRPWSKTDRCGRFLIHPGEHHGYCSRQCDSRARQQASRGRRKTPSP